MDVLIIEDELPARAKLIDMLKTLDPSISIAAQLGSVKETLEWLRQNKEPHLAFVDIQLSDDHSFEIFRQQPVKFPVIFTTAFDKYMMESFEFNSIDYLLKPITEDKLKRSLEKVKKLEQHFFLGNLQKIIQQQHIPSTGRIVAKKGTEFVALNQDEIAYFFSEHKIVFVRDFTGRQMIVDKNLGELENEMSSKFFRLNRKFLASQKAIEKFKPDNGKIQVFLKPEIKEDVHVSKETAPEFRQWIGS
ncbi:MAG TPA: LytTR family DNA-binding domain-containing protein [Cyclobacteriaceae bacterium]|jgi:DNA-binding LytR/AlgR family response regulator|nr:LytTR family DNA-binding domain-containing protein [Cyclobacteriaceae bacterium]